MNLQTFLDDFLNNDDLKLLVQDAGELFHCPVMVVDVAFRAIAWHSPAGFEDKMFQGSAARGCLTYETSSFLAGHTTGAQYVTLPDSPYQRRFSPLITGGVLVGYLILVDVHNALRTMDEALFPQAESALAKQLSLEISRSSQAASTRESVLIRLLEGSFTDESLFRLQAEAAGLGRFSPKRLALANLELYLDTQWTEDALRSALLDIFPSSRPLIHDGNVVFFLNSEPDMTLFHNISEQFRLRIAISAPIENLFRLPEVYAVTRELMGHLLPLRPDPFAVCVEHFCALLLLRRLSGCEELALPAVRALAEHDAREQTLYCQTLYTYLCCHHSLQETCAALYTHRNTVLYRIRRMKEDFDIPVDDPSQHLPLLVSTALMLWAQGQEALFMPADRASDD
ncbi:MAG: helix-turn-helix domain-containing protein [Clostridia bacterium]|nr:helix-turn-helix domain-containing protein [Clostridia bacterium]